MRLRGIGSSGKPTWRDRSRWEDRYSTYNAQGLSLGAAPSGLRGRRAYGQGQRGAAAVWDAAVGEQVSEKASHGQARGGTRWYGRSAATAGLLLVAAGVLTACDSLNRLSVDLGFKEPVVAKPTIPTPLAALQYEAEDEIDSDSALPSFVVSHAQVLLNDLGYPIGVVDGVKGPRTMAAIRAFQKAQGLSADGRVSATLLAQLQVARRELMVRETQARLARLGYKIGPIDGRTGPRTRAAISVFQESEGLPVTGKVTPELVERLYSIFPPAQPKPELQAGPISPPTMRGRGFSRIEAAEAALAEVERLQIGREQQGLQLRQAPAGQTPEGQTSEGQTSPGQILTVQIAPGQTAEAASADQETVEIMRPSTEPAGGGAGEAPNLAARPVISLSRTSPHDERDGRPLSVGDRVRLSIGDAGSNVIEREIDDSGQLELPGDVSVLAAGLTLAELEYAITIKLVESFLLDLNVDVTRPGLTTDDAANGSSGSSVGGSGETVGRPDPTGP